ncbi:hypothetical protein MJO29_007600 [Puccinia striiformis f. sp. tritici]|uniref:hypothetical protein n=1 Tax=Puccinia striiformis f. sp. tritici TaxID=168172 RepID=UPI0020080898|nr:hypothetical protein Pst134EA_013750 [Puccinia striiformis f. sp. tritici]KAH9454651.1 hypothetical protein Pst134EB_014717 [Puccinia striiformis f. sp. tritici]KAH9465890.1 hypothetical protein Pst134EA_013750 [Puccinia striiformis f. sp. tritici]KAI7956201.1 hypothetical protein MJO29_007600 [Puccinia striiformis f. sp. tritici]KAI9604136.1 hypothetical protein H4Q26_003748 [Puccinia striiformis f. sp. tritici PST-130]
MSDGDASEVESILSWTSEERQSDLLASSDTSSLWLDDQAESTLDIDEESSGWSEAEWFSDDPDEESDVLELTDDDSISMKSGDNNDGSIPLGEGSRVTTLEKIETFVLEILRQITRYRRHHSPGAGSPNSPAKRRKLRFPRNSPRRRTASGARELAQLLRVLELSHDLLLKNKIMTKRDVFYNDVNLFKKQSAVDRLIDDLAATLDLTRGQLHFAASPKGLFQGDLELVTNVGNIVTSGHGPPVLIPPSETIKELRPGAKIEFILIIEKEAIFNLLVDSNFSSDPRLGTSILICGIGYPSLSTRQLASRLSEHEDVVRRQVPIFVLVDCDPHGLDIAKVYKFGSQAMSFHPGLCAKQAEWLGISSSDWIEFGINYDRLCAMSPHDYKKADSMLMLDILPESWKNELKRMIESGKKSEIEILCSHADRKCQAVDPQAQAFYQDFNNHPLVIYLYIKIKQAKFPSMHETKVVVEMADVSM